jgi:hypothetical protein
MQTRLWELSKFQPIGTHQEEKAKKFCSFQIREEGTKLNSSTQNANGFALSQILDPTPGDAVTKLNIKNVFATCREKYCSINGAPIGRLLDEGMRKERAMLTQAETKSKMPFGNRNVRPDKSDGSDPQFAKLKKDLTLAQGKIANLMNQLHQAKENMAKERADRSSKIKKEDSPDDEVGSKRASQQGKRAKASKPGPSPPSSPRKGFKMLPTGDYSDSEEEEDYQELNVRATYAKAKFARIQPIIQKQAVRMEIEPRPTRTRAGQVITRTHQRSIDLAIDSLQDDGDSSQPNLETDDDDQESVNVNPQFEVQDEHGIIEFMHNINYDFSGRNHPNSQANRSDCAFTQHSAWTNRAYRTIIGVVGCIRQWHLGSF